MTDDQIKTVLILKYGTLENACVTWLDPDASGFSHEEQEYIRNLIQEFQNTI